MILIGIVCYLVMMFAIGVYASRKTSSVTDFLLAGRDMSLVVCTVSILATWFGGGPMLGSAAAAYNGDYLQVVLDPMGAALCLFLVGFFFARTFRRSRRTTWIEFLQARFGTLAAAVGMFADLVGATIWMGAMLFSFGVVFQLLTGLPLALGIVGGALIIVAYTMIGGLWAVAMTDLFQMLFIVAGILGLFAVVVQDAGGWAEIAPQLPDNLFRRLPEEADWREWLHYWHAWAGGAIAGILSTVIIQRAMAARTEKVAQNAFYIAAFAYATLGIIPVVLGSIAAVTMPGVADPNAIIAMLAIEHLPPIAVVIFVGAIVSAILSTSDSVLLGCGAIVSTNLLPLVRPQASDQERLVVARWTIPIAAAAAIYIAFNSESILAVMLDSIALLLAADIAPFILCIWWQKTNNTGALAGMFSGLVAWALTSHWDAELPGDLVGFVVSFTVTVLVSQLTQRVDPPKALTDVDGNALSLANRIGIPGR